MKTGFKKWVWSKELIVNSKYQVLWNGEIINIDNIDIPLEILIKAIWAINREREWRIVMDEHYIRVEPCKEQTTFIPNYFYNRYNSEQEALEKALEYIYKQGQINETICDTAS